MRVTSDVCFIRGHKYTAHFMQNKLLWCCCSNHMHLSWAKKLRLVWTNKEGQQLVLEKHRKTGMTTFKFHFSLSHSLWHWGARLVTRTYQLWHLPDPMWYICAVNVFKFLLQDWPPWHNTGCQCFQVCLMQDWLPWQPSICCVGQMVWHNYISGWSAMDNLSCSLIQCWHTDWYISLSRWYLQACDHSVLTTTTITIYFIHPSGKLKLLFDHLH